MSGAVLPGTGSSPTPAGPTARNVILACAAALVGNLLALADGSAAGATWRTTAPEPINAVTVAAFTIIPLALAAWVTSLASRRWTGFAGWAAWAGLLLAVATTPMPFVAAADTTTAVSLACMHVVTGAAWFLAVHPRRGAAATSDARTAAGRGLV